MIDKSEWGRLNLVKSVFYFSINAFHSLDIFALFLWSLETIELSTFYVIWCRWSFPAIDILLFSYGLLTSVCEKWVAIFHLHQPQRHRSHKKDLSDLPYELSFLIRIIRIHHMRRFTPVAVREIRNFFSSFQFSTQHVSSKKVSRALMLIRKWLGRLTPTQKPNEWVENFDLWAAIKHFGKF